MTAAQRMHAIRLMGMVSKNPQAASRLGISARMAGPAAGEAVKVGSALDREGRPSAVGCGQDETEARS